MCVRNANYRRKQCFCAQTLITQQKRSSQLEGFAITKCARTRYIINKLKALAVHCWDGSYLNVNSSTTAVGKALFAWASGARAQTNGDTALKIELRGVRAMAAPAQTSPGHPLPRAQPP